MKKHVENLINYEIKKGVISKRDYVYVKNRLYDLLNLELSDDVIKADEINYVADSLNPILDKLVENGVINDTVVERDLFDAKIMNVFAKLPSVLQNEFDSLKKSNPEAATNFLYDYVTNLNYIRKDRIEKNLYFKRDSKYGFLEITINLSKPEKDPKSIALAAKQQASAYPKCVLCKENEGFSGNFNRDSRNQHRLIEFELLNEDWYFQYSPYIYYNEHAIVFTGTHKPMSISEATFERLVGLTEEFKGYFFGSNADLPIVGGSILSHEHYQGGKHVFAIEEAPILKTFESNDVKLEIVNWPLSTIRVSSKNKRSLLNYANVILTDWRKYSNDDLGIKAFTNDTPHNTITPIARFKDGIYSLDLILRNNLTSELHPMGIFHPHSDKWHIKKENIGLIEAIGLAILPGRLVDELNSVKDYLINDKKLTGDLEKHLTWANSFKDRVNKDNVDEIVEVELSKVFESILEDCGVFKLNEGGIDSFTKFVEGVVNNAK